MQWLGSITDSMDMNLNKFQEIVEDRGVWRAIVHGVAKNQTAPNQGLMNIYLRTLISSSVEIGRNCR